MPQNNKTQTQIIGKTNVFIKYFYNVTITNNVLKPLFILRNNQKSYF